MMNIAIDSALLAAAIRDGAAAKKSTLEILTCARLEAHGETLTVTTFDTLVRVTARLPATVLSPGALCVSADKLRAAMAGGGLVELTETSASLMVKRGSSSRVRLETRPADEFPTFDGLRWTDAGIDPEALASAIDASDYAMARNDIRQYLCGIQVAQRYIGATDGYRMAMLRTPNDVTQIIIPRAGIGALRRRLDGAKSLQLGLSSSGRPTRIALRGDDDLEIQLVDVKAPDLEIIIPHADPRAELTIESAALLAAIDRLMPFCTRPIKGGSTSGCLISISPDGLRIATKDEESFELVSVESMTGETTRGGVDLNYIREAVAAIGAKIIRIEDNTDRFILSADGTQQIHVAMGMRL